MTYLILPPLSQHNDLELTFLDLSDRITTPSPESGPRNPVHIPTINLKPSNVYTFGFNSHMLHTLRQQVHPGNARSWK